jgi:hypothetical protein
MFDPGAWVDNERDPCRGSLKVNPKGGSMSRSALFISVTSMCVAAAVGLAVAQTPPQISSSNQVQKALNAMSRVVDHTQRLISAKNFNQLPRENEEFMEGSDALKQSIASEPAAFKTKVEALIEKADANSKDQAAASQGSDASRLSNLHGELANSVRQVVAAFPSNVPSPANLSEEKQEEKSNTTGAAK